MSSQNLSRSDCVLHTILIEQMGANCYIFGSKKSKKVVIIDPGGESEKIKTFLDEYNLTPEFIINTHGHIDHIGANSDFDLPIYIHKDDANFLTNPFLSLAVFYGNLKKSPPASRVLEDGDDIVISDLVLKVIHTPGHTPGGIALYYNGIVFTGDTLFAAGIGRTDFPYSSTKDIVSSIKDRLFSLADETVVLPGHGDKTTIGKERKTILWP